MTFTRASGQTCLFEPAFKQLCYLYGMPSLKMKVQRSWQRFKTILLLLEEG